MLEPLAQTLVELLHVDTPPIRTTTAVTNPRNTPVGGSAPVNLSVLRPTSNIVACASHLNVMPGSDLTRILPS